MTKALSWQVPRRLMKDEAGTHLAPIPRASSDRAWSAALAYVVLCETALGDSRARCEQADLRAPSFLADR